MTAQDEDDRDPLLACLAYQRASVLSIVKGLSEDNWHTAAVPSGWTPAGLVQHVGDVERHWFQSVVAGESAELPSDEHRPPYDPEAAFVSDWPAADVVAYYREQCARSDAILARMPLSAAPLGKHWNTHYEGETVRHIVLHVIEETACHAGHLDIARELLDGRVDLGLR